MRKLALMMLIIFSSFAVSGCSNVLISQKDQALFEQMMELEQKVQAEEWQQAEGKLLELQEIHQKRLWKMQILGGINDNKDVERDLQRLKVSIAEKEKLEAKSVLAEIKQRIIFIYNL